MFYALCARFWMLKLLISSSIFDSLDTTYEKPSANDENNETN
jgi:hypothetical protein